MNILFVIAGYISMILTTFSYLPQIVTVIIHKSGKNISYPYLVLLVVDVLLYLMYGIGFILDNTLDAIPMIIGASLQLVLLFTLCILKLYCNTRKKILQRITNTEQNNDISEDKQVNSEKKIQVGEIHDEHI
mgnify:CR=1 FL=1|tara:strand:+ start:776 stop:1171 length:396 start_codon:yes stop_codon:yes gene_type:complete